MSPRVNLRHNLEAGGLNTAPPPHPESPFVADCAVCSEGFAPGIAYSCRECTRTTTTSAVSLAVAVGLAVLLFAALLVSRLGNVAHSRTEEGIEMDRSLWNKCWSCGAFLVNMLPSVAIKIVVTVWQIVSQVQVFWLHHSIAT